MVLALVRDLLLGSKITGVSKAQGIALTLVRHPPKLAETPGDLLLVDLNLDGAIDAAGAWKRADPNRRVIGFVQHTDVVAIEAARSAGIDQVMARGAFFGSIDQILKS